MTATVTRRGDNIRALDMFCGFGGSSQGIHAEGADVVAAANHNQLAIDTHAANFPDTEHFRADLVDPDAGDYVDPADLPYADFAWFSPACTHHSQANAKKVYEQGRQASLFDDPEYAEAEYVNSERSRVTMSCVLRYTAKHLPPIIAVENVVEVCQWGPGRDGSTYRWWLNELNKLGYNIRELYLNSQFFPPCPQSRDRIYIVAWRKGVPTPNLDHRPHAHCPRCDAVVRARQSWHRPKKSWPRPRWGKYGKQYVYACPEHPNTEVHPVAWPAYTAIDWSNLGPTLAERDRPLADKTVERIRRGLAKFRHGPPVLIPAKSVFGSDRTVLEPLATQTTQQERALVTQGGVIPLRSGNAPGALGDPIGTVATRTDQALLTQGIVVAAAGHTHERPGQTRARHIGDQLFTQHQTMAYGFAAMPATVEMRGGGSVAAGQHAVTDPLHTVTAGGFHHGLMTQPFMLNGQENDSARGVTDPSFTLRANGGAPRLVVDGAMWQKINGDPGDTAWHGPDEPLNTITGRDTTGLVVLPWLDQFRSDPAAVTEQMATVMTHLRHALASIEPAGLDRITDEDLQSVRFRMLEPDTELRRAMAFGDEYVLLGNKSQMTSGLGNAVTPPVAAWITRQCLASLGGGITNRPAA